MWVRVKGRTTVPVCPVFPFLVFLRCVSGLDVQTLQRTDWGVGARLFPGGAGAGLDWLAASGVSCASGDGPGFGLVWFR